MCLLRWLDKNLEEFFLAVLLSVMVFTAGAQVYMRYIVNMSLAWSEELSRYSYVWSGFISIGYCYKRRSALRIDAMLKLFPRKACIVMEIFVNLLSTALFALLFYTSCKIISSRSILIQVSPALQMPMTVLYAAPVLGFLIALFRLGQCIVVQFGNLFQKEK